MKIITVATLHVGFPIEEAGASLRQGAQ